ncbi:MAG: glutamate racemase [Methylophilaceae bacterium]|nr:glutamate racemase [Methylophilaceae bacterium]
MTTNLTQNQLSKARPIGVLDSGVGGLSVLKHIHALLPQEHLIYFADSKHAPYGNKTPKQIEQRVFAVAKFLLAHGAKALVIACNTATAAAAESLREKYAFLDIPIIGMEPAVKPAAEVTKNGIIGVLATSGTLKSAQFAALLESYGRNVQVVTQACIGLVEQIELGELNSPKTLHLIMRYTKPLLDEHADTIVLGCTHYPFVKSAIQQAVGPDIHLIHTGIALARQLQKKLVECDLSTFENKKANVIIWTNSIEPNSELVIKSLWGSNSVTSEAEIRHV